MSLINDALKRAKQAPPPPAPSHSPQLHFRPVEENRTARHGFGVMMPVAFALVALLVLFLGWELAQKNAATKQAASDGDLFPLGCCHYIPQKRVVKGVSPLG